MTIPYLLHCSASAAKPKRGGDESTHLGVSMLQPRSVGPIVFSSASNSYGKSRCKKDRKRKLQGCTGNFETL